MESNTPVVIAGSGPVGSLMALYLAGREVPVLLLEKEPERPVKLAWWKVFSNRSRISPSSEATRSSYCLFCRI